MTRLPQVADRLRTIKKVDAGAVVLPAYPSIVAPLQLQEWTPGNPEPQSAIPTVGGMSPDAGCGECGQEAELLLRAQPELSGAFSPPSDQRAGRESEDAQRTDNSLHSERQVMSLITQVAISTAGSASDRCASEAVEVVELFHIALRALPALLATGTIAGGD